MIIQEINIACGGNTYENCTLIVPSQILTSTPQEETLDLEKSPNFQIVVPAAYLDKGIYEVTFSVDGNDCTANMIVVTNGVNCTLQYVDGLTVDDSSSDDSSDDDHSLEFNYSVFNTSYNLGTGESVDSVQCQLLYDGEAVTAPYSYFDKQGVDGYSYNKYEGKLYRVVWSPKTSFPEMAVGTFTDTVTASYMGHTAICQVVLTVTETVPEVDPVLSESINTILGSNYDVVNDMSEEDALAAANNILYGEETPL